MRRYHHDIVAKNIGLCLFWLHAASIPMTERQANTLNLFLDGYEAKITSKNWAEINKCSKDTAIRDITDLVQKGLLKEDIPGAKRPSYSICYGGEFPEMVKLFPDATVINEDGDFYLTATFKGQLVRERILKLDADRYKKGALTLNHLLNKYLAYLSA